MSSNGAQIWRQLHCRISQTLLDLEHPSYLSSRCFLSFLHYHLSSVHCPPHQPVHPRVHGGREVRTLDTGHCPWASAVHGIYDFNGYSTRTLHLRLLEERWSISLLTCGFKDISWSFLQTSSVPSLLITGSFHPQVIWGTIDLEKSGQWSTG